MDMCCERHYDCEHSCGNECGCNDNQTLYVNVYRVYQCYGGPEEGGWWYNAGEPIESVRVKDMTERDQVIQKLEKDYEIVDGKYVPLDPENVDRDRKYGMYSCAGGYDIWVYPENHFASPWPTQRPYYE